MRTNSLLYTGIFVLVIMIIPAFTGCKGGSTDNGGLAENHSQLKMEMVKIFEGPGGVEVLDIEFDSEGNIYLTGSLTGIVDLDPGEGEAIEQAAGSNNRNAFLAKYDSVGNYIWSLSWGSGENEDGHKVEVDERGKIYVCGSFSGSTDLNPGPGVAVRYDIRLGGRYISRFNQQGGFEWARTWEVGGFRFQLSEFHRTIDGRLVLVGSFNTTADFDPGPEVFEMSPDGDRSAFLLVLNSEGEFEWAKQWGSGFNIAADGVTSDSAGNFFVSGHFRIDPPQEVAQHGSEIIVTTMDYIAKFSSTGEPEWWRSWGGPATASRGNSISLSSDDRVYVAGWFEGSVDLDPGPGTYQPIESGEENMYISGFNSDGDFTGALTVSAGCVDTLSMLPLQDGSIFMLSNIAGKVDIDPGPGELIIETKTVDADGNYVDSFMLCRYGADGRLLMFDYNTEIPGLMPSCFTVDSSGNIFLAGQFGGMLDFDPGPGEFISESDQESGDGYLIKFSQIQ